MFQDTVSIERKPERHRLKATATIIWPLKQCLIGVLQLIGSLANCMWQLEPEFQKRLFSEDFLTEGCLLDDMLFASLSILLKWCRDHRDWSVDQWVTGLIMNDSLMNLDSA
ncbi:hypothetical protein TNCV_2824851 [Trichonephila clavipes]|nr:hypothetical protein TNCV_2824851 [Trichonephila clavipes]